ncbi:dNTP triphosphohydrolase [Peptococcaceae bacterium 1198_IL3148]
MGRMSHFKPKFRDEIEIDQRTLLAPYAVLSPKEGSRLYDEPVINTPTRTEFQRDRDRIIHSKAFRRLMYKTQVFVNHEGDHFRTRLTHSLEVAQIARGIARSLHVNEDLTEAIALGHDLGHTPFGHAVESYLNDQLKNEGGFLHNQNSVRVVELLEEKKGLPFGYGLNLTSEVREGILKHTKDTTKIYTSLEPEKPGSIEGQIVYFADKIAYITHDLEDGINSGILRDLIESGLLTPKDIDSLWDMFNADQNWGVSSIINKLVVDLVEGTIEHLAELDPKSPEDIRNLNHDVLRLKNYKTQYDTMKQFVEKYIYGSPLAEIMDSKAKRIINRLYRSFSQNPKQLPYDVYAKFCNPDIYPRRDGYYTTPNRILCDFLASMTDRYAILMYSKIFTPTERIISV